MAKIGVDTIRKALGDFEMLSQRRGIEIDAYPEIKFVYEMFEYPLTQLEKYGENDMIESDIKDERAAYIFAYFVREHLLQLIGMAKELDQEYAS